LRVAIIICLLAAACDYRPTLYSNTPAAFFEVEATVIKDDNTSSSLFEADFTRNGAPYDSATILFAGQQIQSSGSGRYRAYSPSFTIPDGNSTIVFASSRDRYSSSTTIEMPGRFSITSITPRNNPSGMAVLVQWLRPAATETTRFFVSVLGKNHLITGVRPVSFYAGGNSSFTIPETAFQDQLGSFRFDIYYVYVGAFTRGFLPAENMWIPVPDSLPVSQIGNPRGRLGYGRICPRDSIFVSF